MKRLIIAMGLVFCVATFANAQGGRQMGTPAERAERQISQLESLKLTADQKAKLTDIFLSQGKSQDSLRATLNGDFEGMREKMAPIQASSKKKIDLVLNDDQKKAYEAILAERRSRMRN
jgi:Spy/CpxP family protein refolding chaperone